MPADFVISRSTLLSSYRTMCGRLPACRVLYALKANSEPEVLQILADAGSGFDVASAEEFEKLLRIGVSPDRVMCSLPVKPRDMLERLAADGCSHFVFDTLAELERIRRVSPNARAILRVLISDVDKESFPLGMDLDDLRSALADGSIDRTRIDGVTFHISRNYRLQTLQRVLERFRHVIELLSPERPLVVNIGGGYRHELPFHLAQKFELDAYYEFLDTWLAETAARHPCVFYCEPGRGIVEPAGSIECDVVLVRQRPEIFEAFLDANIGKPPGGHPSRIDVIHANGELEEVYDVAWHTSGSTGGGRTWQTKLVDTVCEYAPLYTLPLKRALAGGERIRLGGLGAYTVSITNYLHSRARPRTLIVP